MRIDWYTVTPRRPDGPTPFHHLLVVIRTRTYSNSSGFLYCCFVFFTDCRPSNHAPLWTDSKATKKERKANGIAAHIAAGCGSRPLRAMDPEAIDCCSDYRCGDFLIRIYIFQFSSLWCFFCFPSSTWKKRGAIMGLPVRIIERDRHNKTQITWLWPA